MRPLFIDDEAKQKVARVVEYAKAHPYYTPAEGTIPGDNPNYAAQLDTYRCVFTFTHSKGKVFRHLSISVPSENYPHPLAVWTIAELFGFTGWDGKTVDRVPSDWLAGMNKDEHCITIMQVAE